MHLSNFLLHQSAPASKKVHVHSLFAPRPPQGSNARQWRSISGGQYDRAAAGPRRLTPPGWRKLAAQGIYVEGADPEITAFQQHQSAAAKPSPAEQSRTLMAAATFAVLSTLSTKQAAPGFPFGSVVQIVADKQGRPIFAASSLSPHTKDLLADPRCSFTVFAAGWKGPEQARLTLLGNATVVQGEERQTVRQAFLKQHPSAFWVDFGDFSWFRLDDMKTANLVPGFGGGYTIEPAAYRSAEADPVTPMAARVCEHMNENHEIDIVNMVRHYVGLTVETAQMRDLDRLGMNLLVTRDQGEFSLRLPFIREATTAKAVKEVLVEMSKASRQEKP